MRTNKLLKFIIIYGIFILFFITHYLLSFRFNHPEKNIIFFKYYILFYPLLLLTLLIKLPTLASMKKVIIFSFFYPYVLSSILNFVFYISLNSNPFRFGIVNVFLFSFVIFYFYFAVFITAIPIIIVGYLNLKIFSITKCKNT
jgi:hypothetical protein